MAFDAARGRVVLFGGSNMDAETWEWDGTRWLARASTVRPPPRRGPAMAFDSVRQRMVLFGGSVLHGSSLNDTWEWDGTNWQERTPAVSPPVGSGAMAFDSARGRTVLLAGTNTWEWDGTVWSLRSVTQLPPPGGHLLAYDSARGRVVLCGSPNGSAPMETWEWDGTVWAQRTPVQSPPRRSVPALAYDSARQRTVLFGGFESGRRVLLSDLWEWDGSTWTQRTTPAAPSERWGHALAFDSARNQLVLFGGEDARGTTSDTFTWDGSAWTLAAPAATPPAGLAAMAIDPVRGRRVMYLRGQVSTSSFPTVPPTTWEWDGTRYRDLSPAVQPSERTGASMVFHESQGRFVLFGGHEGAKPFSPWNDTWEWDGAAWTERTPAVRPAARGDAALAYDPGRGLTWLFGGTRFFGGPFNDTWQWDGTNWLQHAPTHVPPAWPGAMAFDRARGRAVLLLGDMSQVPETWEWDGTDWHQRAPGRSPSPRSRAALGYDAARGRVVLFGGMDTFNTFLQDTWEWDGNDWSPRGTAATPSARFTSLAYDPTRRKVVLYGGVFAGADTWEYGPVHPAGLTAFGTGCPGSAGVPALVGVDGMLPWLGDGFALRAHNLVPGNSALVWIGDSRTAWGPVGLPLDLTGIGMPGCALRTSPVTAHPLFNWNGSAELRLTMPGDPALRGMPFFAQVLSLDRTANAFGATTSQGIEAVIGAR